MRAEISSDLLLRLMNATPEQYAAVDRVLGVKGENGGTNRDACCVKREQQARYVFRRAGSHWDVVFDGSETFHLEHTVGARYADFLLHRPGEVISAFDLELAICPEKVNARARNSIQSKLDPETVRSYLRELTRLREERALAAERGDLAGTDQLDADIEAVAEALQSNGCEPGEAGERARNNVRKAVGVVIRRLNQGGPAERQFAVHLARHLSLGFEVMYQPPGGAVWS